jgi:hypothetical protein
LVNEDNFKRALSLQNGPHLLSNAIAVAAMKKIFMARDPDHFQKKEEYSNVLL